ncbi:MAG: 50S ribosomal protein L9 [Gammaproteobacteria bacterium]|nr:50S ribosomal protein L9 [Gammaproteobacteria bacterium]
MEVILLEKIDNLGTIGDRVRVRSGYGRNYLLPKGKATLATAENIAIFEERRAELERKQADEMAAAGARADQIGALRIKLLAKAGTEGKIFGSLGTIDIAEACTEAGVPVERSEVRLPDGPLRTLGEHEIEIHLSSDVNVNLRVEVVSDGEPPVEIEDFDAPADDQEEAGDDDAEAPSA